jgi:hypothetical protein
VFPLDVFSRERTFCLLVNAYLGRMRSGLYPERRVGRMEMGSARSRPLRTDRQSNHVYLDSYRTNHPPCYGLGCGVRLVVDSAPPVGGSVRSCRETAFLLRRLRPGEAGEGFHSFEGPLAGCTSSTAGAAPDSETHEGTIHLLGLQPYGRAWNR